MIWWRIFIGFGGAIIGIANAIHTKELGWIASACFALAYGAHGFNCKGEKE